MGDFIALLNGFNLTPLNTVLLVVLGLFIKWAVKQTFARLDELDERLTAVEKTNRKQNHAIWRVEQKLGLEPVPDDIES